MNHHRGDLGVEALRFHDGRGRSMQKLVPERVRSGFLAKQRLDGQQPFPFARRLRLSPLADCRTEGLIDLSLNGEADETLAGSDESEHIALALAPAAWQRHLVFGQGKQKLARPERAFDHCRHLRRQAR